MKKYTYIIIGIVVAAVIVIVVLFLIKSHSAGPTLVTSNTSSTAGSLPVAGSQSTTSTSASGGTPVSTLGLTPMASTTASSSPAPILASGQMTVQSFGVLSQSPILDYFVNPENTVTAIEPTGEVISIANGQTTTVNSSTINDIISASFSYDGEKILVNYGDPSDPQSGIYDLATNVWTSLPQGMLSPQWSPIANYEIAYLVTTNNGELALATLNAADLKASPAVVLTLSAQDLTLQWPTKSEFILSDKPSSQSVGSIWSFNSQTGIFAALVYQASGVESTWSHSTTFPDGLLFSSVTPGQSQLQLQSLLPGNPGPETLSFLTLPSKCTFNPELMPIPTSTAPIASSTTTTASTTSTPKTKAPVVTAAAPTSTPYLALYCGIPRSSSGFSSANLPDAYNMMGLFTSDDIYKINTQTGAEQSLWSDPTQNMDTSDMKFFNSALFFVNRYDQKLYGLTLSSD